MSKSNILVMLLSTSLLAACQPAATKLAELSPPEQQLFEQASEQRKQGNVSEAITLYTQAARLSSGAVEAHIAIAEMLRAENKAAQSMSMINDALLLQPADARLFMEKGFAYIAKGEYAPAIDQFNQAIRLDADMGSAYSGKAVAYDLQGQHTQAQEIYAQAVAQGLTSPALENNYALSLVFSGKLDQAIAMLKPHADASYATASMKQNLALAYGLKGDVGRAAHYGNQNLDPILAEKNKEFYKRYSALKYGNQPTTTIAITNAEKAVPVAPVESSDIGFATGAAGNEVLLKPNVEVLEVDAAAFEELTQ